MIRTLTRAASLTALLFTTLAPPTLAAAVINHGEGLEPQARRAAAGVRPGPGAGAAGAGVRPGAGVGVGAPGPGPATGAPRANYWANNANGRVFYYEGQPYDFVGRPGGYYYNASNGYWHPDYGWWNQARSCWLDRDGNPPGVAGGAGTNWENPPGLAGGPGASPDRYGRCK